MTDFLDDTTLKRFRPQRGTAPSTFSSLAPDPLSANLAGDVDTAPGTGATDTGAPPASAAPKPYDNKENYGLLTENSQLAGADNPMVQQFVQRFGQTPGTWDPVTGFGSENQTLGGYVVGRGTPTFSGNEIGEWGVDPSRVAYFDAAGKPTDQPAEDGWYVIEGGNARGDAIASMQDVDSRQRNREVWQSSVPSALTGLPIGHGPLVEDMNEIAKVVGPAVAAYFLGPMALEALGPAAAASPWVEGSTGLLELGAEAGAGELGSLAGADFLGEELGSQLAGSELLGEAGADLAPTLAEPGAELLSEAALAPGAQAPGLDIPSGIDANFVPPGVANPTLSPVTPSIPAMPDIPGASNPGMLSRMLGKITDNPLTAAGLGLTAYNTLANKPSGTAADELRNAAKPISAQAESLLAQYGRGEINPGDEFNINKWEHDQIARAQSFYASSGQGDSSAALAAVGAIQQQAQAMRNQALQGLLQAGLQASGMALGPLTAAIQAQAAEDENFSRATSGALNSLLLLQAMGGKPAAGVPTPTG